MRHPRRSRSVSIGPQSQADAYEALAFRETQRKKSKQTLRASSVEVSERSEQPEHFSLPASNNTSRRLAPAMLPTPPSSRTNLYESMVGAEPALYTPNELEPLQMNSLSSRRPSQERRRFEKEDKEMFSKLEKPRVRYDVEVVTKLIVYAGKRTLISSGLPKELADLTKILQASRGLQQMAPLSCSRLLDWV